MAHVLELGRKNNCKWREWMSDPVLPEGSRIQTRFTREVMSIRWVNPDNLFYWLGMAAFLLFWLGGWTIAGIIVLGYLFALFKDGRSQLLLGNDKLVYKPGRIPISSLFTANQRQTGNYFKILAGGKPIAAGKYEITNLDIGYAGDRLRVTFDRGAERIEVGEYLSEPEKEWLYKAIGNWLG